MVIMPMQASADKAPPLLDVAAAIAAAPLLAPLLGDVAADAQSAPWATEQNLGSTGHLGSRCPVCSVLAAKAQY